MTSRGRDLLGFEDDPEDEPSSQEDWRPGDWADVRKGVNLDWLAGAFRMDRRKTRSRIAGCKVIGRGSNNSALYDLREAASHLVPNVASVMAAVREMKSGDLPASLQKDVWDARLKELSWREKAGELWPTIAVAEVLSDTFKTMKQSMQLWVDNLEREDDLDPALRAKIVAMVDALQTDIHGRLVELPSLKQTPNASAAYPEVFYDD